MYSNYSGIVNSSCDIMFGGVIIVVIMNVFIIMYGFVCCSLFRFMMLKCISIIMIIGILKVMLKVRNVVMVKFKYLLMLVDILVFSGVL